MSKVTVLGGGGWAIALAKVLCENGNDVTIWSAVEREVEALSKDRENKISLPGIIIPDEMKVTGDLDEAIKDVDVIVMAVASSFVRPTAHSLQGKIKEGQIIVDVAKGIEDDTFNTMSEIIKEELPECDPVVLSGPSHAEEVGRQIPTSVVIGSKNEDTAEFIQKLFANDYFRVYRSPDMKSIELGGSLKNVIALAAGVIYGLGFGDNTEAGFLEICLRGSVSSSPCQDVPGCSATPPPRAVLDEPEHKLLPPPRGDIYAGSVFSPQRALCCRQPCTPRTGTAGRPSPSRVTVQTPCRTCSVPPEDTTPGPVRPPRETGAGRSMKFQSSSITAQLGFEVAPSLAQL